MAARKRETAAVTGVPRLPRVPRVPLSSLSPPAPPLGRPGDPGLVTPGGVYQRLWGDRRVLLGAPTWLLLQIAHPLVGAGVVAHSEYRSRPEHRLVNTLQSPLIAAFGDTRQAHDHAMEIQRIHTPVRGRLPETVGSYGVGESYSARNPTLALWVWASLMMTVYQVHHRYGVVLDKDAREDYYQQSKQYGRLFEIPEAKIPSTWSSFIDYWDSIIPTLEVSPAVADVGYDVLHGRTWPPVPGVGSAMRAVAADLLPRHLQAAFDVPLSPVRRGQVKALGVLLPKVWSYAPRRVREFPHVAHFEQRMHAKDSASR